MMVSFSMQVALSMTQVAGGAGGGQSPLPAARAVGILTWLKATAKQQKAIAVQIAIVLCGLTILASVPHHSFKRYM
jgi:hypothetical protein